MVTDSNALTIYTDGSFYPANRCGGFSMLFIFPEHLNKENINVTPYGYQKTTNNQMELKACCSALSESLKLEKEWQRIIIYTDSSYVCNNYDSARYRWCNNHWCNDYGRPVSNSDIWKELLVNVKKTRCSVDIRWVKGHSKSENNKLVDRMAKVSARKAVNKPLTLVGARRKISNKKTELGSVLILGQRISIRIITAEYLPQGFYKYKYEIISSSSHYSGCVDMIYSDISLRVGHKFSVRLNDDKKFPKITKVYRDITKIERKIKEENDKIEEE